MPAAKFDYESQTSYTLEVTVSDGVFQHVNNLTINIDNVNEGPSFTSINKHTAILENETNSRIAIDMDASDPENDVLTYQILGSNPSGPPFTIDSSNGNCTVIFFRVLNFK